MIRFHHIRPRVVSDRVEPHGRGAPWDKRPSHFQTLRELERVTGESIVVGVGVCTLVLVAAWAWCILA